MADEAVEKVPMDNDKSNVNTEGIIKKSEESNIAKVEDNKKIDDEAKIQEEVIVKKPKVNVKNDNVRKGEYGKETPSLSPFTDKGAESDLPDDFFDDFGKDEFMSALEVVDSFDSFDEKNQNDDESNKDRGTRSRGYRSRYKIDNRVGDKRLDDLDLYARRRPRVETKDLEMVVSEEDSYERRRPRVETKELEAAVSEESERIRKKLEKVRQDIANSQSRNEINYQRRSSRKRDSYDRTSLDQRHRRSSPQNRDYRRESERKPHDSRESRDWRPHESRDQTSRERKHHDSGDRTSRERRRYDSGERTSRDRRRSQNRRPIVESDRGRSRSRSPRLVTGTRRDISKTNMAILTDKNKKAKDLLEKRVETGLIPPGMETEFDLSSRDRRRSHSNSPKYREDRHSRLPAASDRHSRLPAASDRHSRLPAASDRHSRLPAASNRYSRLPAASDSHHRSRQRSPFIKELARKLKEKSEERQLVQMLNPMRAPYSQEPPIYNYGPPGATPYFPDPYGPSPVLMAGPIPHTMSMPMHSPMPGSMPNPMTYISPVTYPEPMLYHSSPMTPGFGPPLNPSVNHNVITSVPVPKIVPAPRPVPKPIPKAPVRPVPPKPKIKIQEPTLDELLDQKKISVADYLKLNVKSTGTPTPKGLIASNSRIDLLSRCQNAVSKLTQFRKPNNLVYNPDMEVTKGESLSSEHAVYRSPLQRRQSVKYGYTTPLALTKAGNERLLTNIVAFIGLQDLKLNEKQDERQGDNMKDASMQTSGIECEVCEIREKYKFASVGTDTDDLIAVESVYSQVTETELQQSKGAPTKNSVSLTHLTPQQILAAELATKARSYMDQQQQQQQQQQQYMNQQQYYKKRFNQQNSNPGDGWVTGYGFRQE